MALPEYCTVADLRDEGVPDPPNDAALLKKIQIASVRFEEYTNRWFEPRTMTFVLDGPGSPVLLLDMPIIELTGIKIGNTTLLLDPDSVIVYNRHIGSPGLVTPDDRDNPRIEIVQPLQDQFRFSIAQKVWPMGQQNIEVTGRFGYTEEDESTPALICEAVKLMVIRDLPAKFSDADEAEEANAAKFVRRVKTRDQEIEYAMPNQLGATGPGPFTGDRRIDDVILRYAAPMRMGAT